MGMIIAVCVGNAKNMPKRSVDCAYLKKGHGIVGDIHAGPGKRQVSLLARKDIELLKGKGIAAQPGDFAENIILEGINFSSVTVGSRFKIGQAVLGITEIGKKEWKPGNYSFRDIPLVATSGLFARVLQSGWVKPGENVLIHSMSK